MQCRFCEAMARGGSWDNERCAYHDGTITSWPLASTPDAVDQCVPPTPDTPERVVVATVSLEADRTNMLGDSTTRNPDRLMALEDVVSAVVEKA